MRYPIRLKVCDSLIVVDVVSLMSMKSAQRKKRLENNARKGRILGILIKVFIPLCLLLSIIIYLKLSAKYWNGVDKFAFVFQRSNGDIGITVLDPVLVEETTLVIPGNTQVNVARNYGILTIKNVWKLGIDEKLGGRLLAQTVTDDFLFPTNLWSDRGIGDVWKFIFENKETNISFGDRLSAGLFAMKVKSIDQTEINLGKSDFLQKQILTDGQQGYILSGQISGRLTQYFSDNRFADKNLKFGIIDQTGSFGVANGLGQILEVLGGKVVSVDKRTTQNTLDCQVAGQNPDVVEKVSELFFCQKISDHTNFDLEVIIGREFAKRF